MARSPKALIIACENYPKGEDIAHTLTGTLDSARACYQWLMKAKGLKAADIYVCCDSELVAGHPADRSYAATRSGVTEAVTDLVERHRNTVNELFVFFSGHGLGYEHSPQQRGLDLLLTTDYRSRKKSGGACINIGELQAQMEIWLGGDDHYYFLDACRTVLKAGEIVPAGLGLALDAATSGDPTTYAICSTKFGEPAPVNPKFPMALLAGLRGEGRAKAALKKEWWVQFDRLQKQIDTLVDTPTDVMKIGPRGGLIVKLEGSFETTASVTVDGALPTTELELRIDLNGVEQSFPFKGPSFVKKLRPSDAGYTIDVFMGKRRLQRLSPPGDAALDLFEPVELRYEVPFVGGPPPAPPAPPPSHGAILGFRGADAPGVSIEVRDEKGMTVLSGSREIVESALPPGRYEIEVSEGGRRVAKREVSLRRGERTTEDFFENSSRVRQSIARHVPNHDEGRVVDFSETLGPTALQHTGLWLSFLGASRIIEDPYVYSKLRDLPLARFDDLNKNDCAVYALAGLEQSNDARISLGRWRQMEVVPGLDGVLHYRAAVKPGQQLISVAFPNQAPVTFASWALPNRAVLFVVVENPEGKIDVWQMLLPIYSLRQYLPDMVSGLAQEEGLRLVRHLVLQQDRLAQRDSQAPLTEGEQRNLNYMLDGKWLDPLLALTSIFEMARRGAVAAEGLKLSAALANLEQYFGELPDVAAARHILDPRKRAPLPAGAPMLRESLLRLPKLQRKLPLPAGLLDYGSIWTSWVGAVKSPYSKGK